MSLFPKGSTAEMASAMIQLALREHFPARIPDEVVENIVSRSETIVLVTHPTCLWPVLDPLDEDEIDEAIDTYRNNLSHLRLGLTPGFEQRYVIATAQLLHFECHLLIHGTCKDCFHHLQDRC